MSWRIEVTHTAKKGLKRLDKITARRVLDYLDGLVPTADPRRTGRALRGPLGKLWRYRVGDYRVFCKIRYDTRQVVVLRVKKRGRAYSPR